MITLPTVIMGKNYKLNLVINVIDQLSLDTKFLWKYKLNKYKYKYKIELPVLQNVLHQDKVVA